MSAQRFTIAQQSNIENEFLQAGIDNDIYP